MGLLRGICGSTTFADQGTVTHIVVDNPSKVRGRVVDLHRQLSSTAKPVVIHVNRVNRGVTSSRNRGIKASGADWIVLQDDDVVPDPDLLQAYSTAIQGHILDDQAQVPLGFCGMIHFPAPYNGFTAAMRMSGVPNAFEIAELTRTPAWGCTANVCLRNGPWLRFLEDWEKTGGGEDMDLFLRLQREVGGAIPSVPKAAVTHPWWDEGSRRAYNHFYLWGKGDGRLQQLHPEHCYRSWPCSVEVLVAMPLVIMVMWIGSKGLSVSLVPLSFLATWLLAVALAVVEIDMLGNVVADRWLWRAVKSESLRGGARARAAMEGALVLMCCEAGQLGYHLRNPRGRWKDICLRFDFFCGCIPAARRAWTKAYALKFVGYVIYGQWLWLSGHLGSEGKLIAKLVLLMHSLLLVFLGSLFVWP